MKKYRDVKLNTDIKMEDELTEEVIVDENADAVEKTVTETEESTEE